MIVVEAAIGDFLLAINSSQASGQHTTWVTISQEKYRQGYD